MDIKRRFLVVTRHGEAPKDPETKTSLDELMPGSVRNIYVRTGGNLRPFVRDKGVTLDKSAIAHSGWKRTLATGKAIIAGAFDLIPIPDTMTDLNGINFSGVEISFEPRLEYDDLEINWPLIKSIGGDEYNRKWFENPKANTLEGGKVTPYNSVLQTRGKCLLDSLGYMIARGKDLMVLGTHGSIAEALIIPVVNSGRNSKRGAVERFEEIGGQFKMEDVAYIQLDGNDKSGVYDLAVRRNGYTTKGDFNALRNMYGGSQQ